MWQPHQVLRQLQDLAIGVWSINNRPHKESNQEWAVNYPLAELKLHQTNLDKQSQKLAPRGRQPLLQRGQLMLNLAQFLQVGVVQKIYPHR